MQLNFAKVNPTENMTIFITDQLSRDLYMNISNKIMNYNNIYAEQVGFIERPNSKDTEACVRLHMMGGEFCVNATRSLAALLVHKEYAGIKKLQGKYIVPLEVSGVDEVLDCEVEKIEADKSSFMVGVKVPLHKNIKEFSTRYKDHVYNGTLVEFPGIIHLVVDSEGINDKELFFKKVKDKLTSSDYEALGIMFYNRKDSYIYPLVYVRETASLCWERGCGSGTAAVGVALSNQKKEGIDIIVKQPGGDLNVTAKWIKDSITSIYIKGEVNIVAEGKVYV